VRPSPPDLGAERPGGAVPVGEIKREDTTLSSSKGFYFCLIVVVACGCVYHSIPTDTQTECGADHERVGQVAELTNRFVHGISGTARIVDNCTIVIEHFNYDGVAVDSRWVGALDGDWANGKVLSGPQMRAGGYQDETIVIPLPEGVTLDDINSISLNCLPGQDFLGNGDLADGFFEAP